MALLERVDEVAAAKNKVAALEFELQQVKRFQPAKDPLGLVKEANKEKTKRLQYSAGGSQAGGIQA